METAELRNFLEFYFTSSMDEDEDIETITGDLKQAGVDAEASRQMALGLIKKAKIDLKIERGKNFKVNFYTLMEKIEPYEIEKEQPKLALAFRKLSEDENPDMDEVLDDKEKMMVMEYLRRHGGESA